MAGEARGVDVDPVGGAFYFLDISISRKRLPGPCREAGARESLGFGSIDAGVLAGEGGIPSGEQGLSSCGVHDGEE